MKDILNEVPTFDTKKEVILSLGVYELRGLARVLGVKSPTTKKREELISLILEIIENNEDFTFPNNAKRGRPFKTLSSVQNILDVIATGSESEEVFTQSFSTYEDLTVFDQEMPVITMQSSDIFPCTGVLRKGKTFGYFVDSSKQRLVYISQDQIAKYELETGDFLDCAVFEINNGTKCFVKKINRINGVIAEEYRPLIYRDYVQTLPTSIEIENKIVSNGGRNVLILKNPLFMNAYLENLLSYFSKSKVVFLGINICYEDKLFVTKNRNIFSFTSDYSSRISDGYDRIIDAINFVGRMSETNEDVFFLVNDFASVLNCLDAYFQNDERQSIYGHKEKTIIIAKKLISLAKAKSNNRNVTNMLICFKDDAENEFIKNELIKISNILE